MNFDQKMNIWIFNHHATLPTHPGGTRHFDFAAKLVERGHQVTIYASGYHYALLEETKAYGTNGTTEEVYAGVRFVWIKTPSYRVNNLKRILNMFAYYFAVLRLGKKSEKKPDVIIGSTVHPLAPIAASKLASLFGIPFVYEIRDLWPQTFIDIGVWKKDSMSSRFFRWLEAKSVKRAAAIIALSPLTLRYLEEHYHAKNVSYIPNGVNLVQFDAPKAFSENVATLKYIQTQRESGKFIIMFTGALVMSNKLDSIIGAAKFLASTAHDSIQILLVGGGQEKQKYQTIIEKEALENVHILNPVKKESVSTLLGLADVLLLVQGKVFYGSTNKLADYMAASKPLLTAISVKHNDPVQQVPCGISVDPDNHREMAEGMIQMKAISVQQRMDMGEAGRKYVEENLSMNLLVQKLEDLLKSLTSVSS